ncbi:DUF5723 family protein [Spirosoma sp. 209]|uniref:DUF5723 family protein n=1 Tax=Spirosoma sp. 209 TaxID=1955701 RepID=UPI001F186B83|nr:DUF5723 family protein [Spirosoma sp. 209]
MPHFFVALVLCLLSAHAFAQRLTAYQLSNYAGTNGVYLNPSSMADSRLGTHINLATVSVQAAAQPRLPLATVPFASASLKLRGQDLAVKEADLRGPGLMVQLRDSKAFAITTRYRSDINLTGGYDLVDWFEGSKAPLPAGNRSVALSSDAFGEVAFSYAMPVFDWQQHFVKAGLTYKYIRGLQSSSLQANGDFSAPSTQVSYSLNSLQTTYSDLATLSKLNVADVLLGSVPGSGSGFDIGVTYEFRPRAESFRYQMDGRPMSDVTQTKYQFRLGLALLDIGSIRYKNASSWTVQPRTGTLQQAAVQPPKTPTEVRNAVAQSLGVLPEGSIGDLTHKLPQTFSVQADAQLGKGWFFGAAWWKPTTADAAAQHRAELITFGPRYESAGSEFSVTGNYWQPLGKFSVGTHVRVGLFTVGTDNLLGFFSDNGLSAHVFAGVALPIGARRPPDRDGDYVSNRRDRCPDLAGIWMFQGCPDTDRDGIQDKDDACPQDAGPAETKGCPDADKDGIFDKNDACPNEAGPARFNGCPDTDNDGIANNDDECPTVAGVPALGGCPDRDQDGLRDSQDACPTEAGLKELDGCALKALEPLPAANLSAAESALLDQLNRRWLLGPKKDDDAIGNLKTYLSANPKRVVVLEFSGGDQEPLVRVANLFKEELGTAFGDTKRFRFSVAVRSGTAAGLRVSFKDE